MQKCTRVFLNSERSPFGTKFVIWSGTIGFVGSVAVMEAFYTRVGQGEIFFGIVGSW